MISVGTFIGIMERREPGCEGALRGVLEALQGCREKVRPRAQRPHPVTRCSLSGYNTTAGALGIIFEGGFLSLPSHRILSLGLKGKRYFS